MATFFQFVCVSSKFVPFFSFFFFPLVLSISLSLSLLCVVCNRERSETANKKKGGGGGGGGGDDWPDSDSSQIEGKRENMSAQDRIAAMKARLAGIRASDIPEDDFAPVKTKPTNPQIGFKTAQPSKAVQQSLAQQAAAQQAAKKPQKFSDGEDDELYEEFTMPSMKKNPSSGGSQQKPKPPPPPRGALEDSGDDVPEIDTRIRSTMALEKHWNEVEEKRKRDEALRKRKLKEK